MTDERQLLRELEREVRDLRRVNEILRDASIVFATELDGRTKKLSATSIREVIVEGSNRSVEPRTSFDTYYHTNSRPVSVRQLRDEALKVQIQRAFNESVDGCYGQLKVWKQLRREVVEVAIRTVRRLRRSLGLSGVRCGCQLKVTTAVPPWCDRATSSNASSPRPLRTDSGSRISPT